MIRIATSAFGRRAAKLFKVIKTGSKGLVPIIDIGFGIWEILEGKQKMAPGGIHNLINLQSRQITHRIADLAAAYTEVVGKTFIDLYLKPSYHSAVSPLEK